MKKVTIRSTLFLLYLSLLLNACGGSSSEETIGERGELISSNLISTKQAIPYQVKAYKLKYSTVAPDGTPINASGLLTIPQKGSGEESPLLSYQHGTIFLDSQAPSVSSTSIGGISSLSGIGFIVSAPDYIGYGDSSSQFHPYIHADSLASASVDMLRASKSFLDRQQIKLNSQLFLTGYSEGGYATLALQKKIQESHSSEFTVTASSAGAGPFDLTKTAETLANKTTNSKPAFMSFLLKAYDDIYDLNKISEMYQVPYVNIINTYFDGQHSGSQITGALSHTTDQLFNTPFLSALQGSGPHVIKDKLSLNNIYDWKPEAPTRFYHSKTDEIVPYHNAQTTLDAMLALGSSNVTLGDCPQNTHTDCIVPYVLDTITFFSTYADDL